AGSGGVRHTYPSGERNRIRLTLARGDRAAVLVRVVERNGTAESDSTWVQLFNGTDLTGWKTHSDQPGNWKVTSGVLTGSGGRSHLFSDGGDFENFHLRVEAKINAEGNSGVIFRSEYGLGFDQKSVSGSGRLPKGYEADIH